MSAPLRMDTTPVLREKLKNSEIATIRTSDRTALDKAWNEYAN